MSMESKVNIYIYLSILIIILMVISIFIQILLMKRIFYFHRDFLEVGESNNRVSKDPIGISQPIIPENSNEKEQSYVSLKEHKEVPVEEKPVMKNDKKLSESQAKGEQEAIALKLKHQSNVDSVSKKTTTDKTHSNDETLKIEHKLSEKSGVYSQNSHSKKSPQHQYSTIVLDQSTAPSKKMKKQKKADEKIKLSEDLKIDATPQKEESPQLINVTELEIDSPSNTKVEEVNSSIESFVKKDLDQLGEKEQASIEIDAIDGESISTATLLVETTEDVAPIDIKASENSQLISSDPLSAEDVLVESKEVIVDQNFNSIQLKETNIEYAADAEIQELVGLENVLRSENIISNDPDANSELKIPVEKGEQKSEHLPIEKESLIISNEQSLEIDEDSKNKIQDILVEQNTIQNQEIVDVQALPEIETANNDSDIVFFAGVNSEFTEQVKHDPLSDILKLEKGILQSLGTKQESDDSKNNGIEKNKTNKLKLFDNVVKKLTTPTEEVDVEVTAHQINPEGHEISMDGIRDTYQRILNSYK